MIVIGYHKDCVDGYAAAWVTYKYLTENETNSEIVLLPLEYHKVPLNELEKADTLYLVDFSIPPSILEELELIVNVTIIDHHKTAIEQYRDYAHSGKSILIFDNEQYRSSLFPVNSIVASSSYG